MRTVVAPLERVKIEYMLDSSKIAADGGVLGSLKRIIRTEGAPALFRGNSLNVLRIAPTKAVEFFVYDTYKARRLKMKQKDQTENEKENNNNTNNKTAAGDLSGGERMIGGSVASMWNCSDASNRYASFARLRDRHAPRSRLVGTHQKRRPESVVERFRREHDSSCSLRRHQLLRVRLLQATIQKVSRAFPQRRRIDAIAVLKSFTDVVFRRARGAAAQTGVYPIELVQRRMQVQGMKTLAHGAKNATQYKNVVQGVVHIARAEGIPALYAGLIPNYTKIFPSAAVSFYVYELLKELWGLQ